MQVAISEARRFQPIVCKQSQKQTCQAQFGARLAWMCHQTLHPTAPHPTRQAQSARARHCYSVQLPPNPTPRTPTSSMPGSQSARLALLAPPGWPAPQSQAPQRRLPGPQAPQAGAPPPWPSASPPGQPAGARSRWAAPGPAAALWQRCHLRQRRCARVRRRCVDSMGSCGHDTSENERNPSCCLMLCAFLHSTLLTTPCNTMCQQEHCG